MNKEIYINAFIESLQINQEIDVEKLKYRDYSWDSVAHMVLIATLEDAFNIQMETDDVIDFSSYEKGIEILSRYGIKL